MSLCIITKIWIKMNLVLFTFLMPFSTKKPHHYLMNEQKSLNHSLFKQFKYLIREDAIGFQIYLTELHFVPNFDFLQRNTIVSQSIQIYSLQKIITLEKGKFDMIMRKNIENLGENNKMVINVYRLLDAVVIRIHR